MSNANQKTLSEQLVEALGTLASKMEEFATDPETTFKLLGWDVVDVQGLEQDWGRRLVLLAKGDKVHVENLLISTKNTAWLEKVAEGWKCLVSDLSRLYAKFEQLPAQRREDQKQAIEKYLSLCREKDPKHVRLSERAKDYNEAEDKEEFLSNLNYDTDDEGVPLETPEWSVRCYFFAIENEERMRLLLKRDGGQAVHDAVSLYRMLQQSILAELGDANRLSEGASQGAAAPPVQEELGETDKVGRFTRKEAKRIGRILLAKRHYVNLPKGDPKKKTRREVAEHYEIPFKKNLHGKQSLKAMERWAEKPVGLEFMDAFANSPKTIEWVQSLKTSELSALKTGETGDD